MPVETPAWVRDAIFYQAFPDRLARSGRVPAPGELEPWDAPPTTHGFKGGDLYGVIDHLDRLRHMGITALYLNPVFASASNHRYHTDDYFHVDPLLGGDEALRALLDEAHGRGMRVVLDGVFNHCGRGFWPFHHVLENGAQSPYRDWFHLDIGVQAAERQLAAYPTVEQLGAMTDLRASGRSRGDISMSVLGYTAWWDLPALPKLRLEDPHMRAYVLDVAEHWIRFGIDGWRLDVAEEVGADFWREFRKRVRAADPEAYLVAEVWHPRPDWLAGDMFDAFMNYPLATAIIGFAAQSRLATAMELPEEYQGQLVPMGGRALWERIRELNALYDPAVTAVQLNLLGSHDTPRLRTLCGGDLDAVRLATMLQLTLPGAPCIYFGDEIGMVGGMDPGCRAAFPVEPERWHQEPAAWFGDLARLRHTSRALRDGELRFLHADGPALAYLRRADTEAFVCVVNAGESALAWELPMADRVRSAEALSLRSARMDRGTADVREGRLHVTVPARHGVVVRLESDQVG